MSIYSKIKIGQAASNYSKFDLSHSHFTTMDFNQICPVNVAQCNIGDKFQVNFNAFSRMAPMVFPTMGQFGLRVLSVFVPTYTIADDVDAYLSGLKQHAGNEVKGRNIKACNLAVGFLGEIAANQVVSDVNNFSVSRYVRFCNEQEEEYIKSIDTDDDNVPRSYFIISKDYQYTKYLTLTSVGKQFYKILRSLGYDIPQRIHFKTNDQKPEEGFSWGSKMLNLYPLISFFKAYADLLLPTSYYNTSNLLKMLYSIKTADDVSGVVNSSTGEVRFSTLEDMFKEITNVFYDSDYFTTAWQSPNSPISSYQVTSSDVYNIHDYGKQFGQTGTNELRSNNTGNIMMHHASSNISGFSQTQLNFLRAFDSFVRRNNISGYREFNTVYSRFGIKPSEMKSQYCELIDVRNIELNVGDVTATAQTEGTNLGSYAGKGFLNGQGSINFDAKDFGYFIQIAHLYVKPVYYQGMSKDVLKSSYLDFYQPEYDGVGPQPISKLELNSSYDDGVFGFTERYNEYRFAQSQITGDFALDPLMTPWHFGREFLNDNVDAVPVAQSLDLLAYGNDNLGNSEYDRIFSTENVNNHYDHFFLQFNFDMSALRKMKTISQALNLGDGDVEIDRNGSV